MSALAFIGGGAASGIVLHFFLMTIWTFTATFAALGAVGCFFKKRVKTGIILLLPALSLAFFIGKDYLKTRQSMKADEKTIVITVCDKGTASIQTNGQLSDSIFTSGTIDFTLNLPDGLTISDTVKSLRTSIPYQSNDLLLEIDYPKKPLEEWRRILTQYGEFSSHGVYIPGGFDDKIQRSSYTAEVVTTHGYHRIHIRFNRALTNPDDSASSGGAPAPPSTRQSLHDFQRATPREPPFPRNQ